MLIGCSRVFDVLRVHVRSLCRRNAMAAMRAGNIKRCANMRESSINKKAAVCRE
jgi:hypothetical protein